MVRIITEDCNTVQVYYHLHIPFVHNSLHTSLKVCRCILETKAQSLKDVHAILHYKASRFLWSWGLQPIVIIALFQIQSYIAHCLSTHVSHKPLRPEQGSCQLLVHLIQQPIIDAYPIIVPTLSRPILSASNQHYLVQINIQFISSIANNTFPQQCVHLITNPPMLLGCILNWSTLHWMSSQFHLNFEKQLFHTANIILHGSKMLLKRYQLLIIVG